MNNWTSEQVLCDMRNGWKLVKRTIYSVPKPDQWRTSWEYTKPETKD